MKRAWRGVAVPALLALLALVAGCGVAPTGVRAVGKAPAGIAPGPTLYFVDSHERIRPQLRPTEQLGTIAEALSELLAGAPAYSDLHTEISAVGTTQVLVTTAPGVIRLTVPLAISEVTARGIEQIVCTALGVDVQGGGPASTKVQVVFTEPTAESDRLRTCPLISPAR